MIKKSFGFIIVLACLIYTQVSWPQGEGMLFENPHREYIKQYEGTKTCPDMPSRECEGGLSVDSLPMEGRGSEYRQCRREKAWEKLIRPTISAQTLRSVGLLF